MEALVGRVTVDQTLYDPHLRSKTIIKREYEANKNYYSTLNVPCIMEVTDDLTGTDTILIASNMSSTDKLQRLYKILLDNPSHLFKVYPPKILDKVNGVYAELLSRDKSMSLLCWPICYHVIVSKGIYYVNVIWCWLNTSGEEFDTCKFTWSSMQVTHADNYDEHWKALNKRLQLSNGAKTRFINIEEAWDQASIQVRV